MRLLSIPANPVPEGAIAGTIGTPDGVTLRFARWATPADGRGTVCVFTGRGEYIEKYFETVQGSAQARLCGGCHRLAGAGTFLAPAGQSVQGPCREFFGVPDRRGGLRRAGRAAGLSAALFCIGPFDGRRGHAARRACRHRGVRTLRALRADDRPAASARVAADARPDATAARGRNGRAVHSRRQHRPDQVNGLSRQSPDLGPAPLCPQRGYTGGRSDARDCVADRGVARRGLCGDGRVSFARVCRRRFASPS